MADYDVGFDASSDVGMTSTSMPAPLSKTGASQGIGSGPLLGNISPRGGVVASGSAKGNTVISPRANATNSTVGASQKVGAVSSVEAGVRATLNILTSKETNLLVSYLFDTFPAKNLPSGEFTGHTKSCDEDLFVAVRISILFHVL